MSCLATISVIGLWKGLFSLVSNVEGLGLGGGDSVGRGPPNHTRRLWHPDRQTPTKYTLSQTPKEEIRFGSFPSFCISYKNIKIPKITIAMLQLQL